VQRDIPMPLVSSGVEKGNLRELALARMAALGLRCRCTADKALNPRSPCVNPRSPVSPHPWTLGRLIPDSGGRPWTPLHELLPDACAGARGGCMGTSGSPSCRQAHHAYAPQCVAPCLAGPLQWQISALPHAKAMPCTPAAAA
jgi:hypothetical protein